MAIETRIILKGFFADGQCPTGDNFSDFIDSYFHKTEDLATGASSGVITGTLGTDNRLVRWSLTGIKDSNVDLSNAGDMTVLSGGNINLDGGGEYQIDGDALAAIHILYDPTTPGDWGSPAPVNVKEALDELSSNIGVGKKYITWSAARHKSNTTDVYLRKSDNLPTNESPFRAPFDATIYTIAAQTNGSESWTAEIRRDTGAGFTTVATLVISAADGGINDIVSFDIDKGDKIAMYCNGANITDPSIELYLVSR